MPHESLFDGRYRYDHIYPRGRSGEAFRAYDVQNDNREVVIKRPAPQDAPPIRAGQEVNIRTERRALLQLKGHPVLVELLDEGTFRIGGQAHLYIVMESASGTILEDMVLALAREQQRLPELETLVILDALLDLLEAAHAHDIVYNDVDAKHLFWNRDSYQLKVIDWGNAVFLEGDAATPQGISRQSDVFQVGELLYFVLTGGQRLVAAGESVDFGADADHITTRLQSIVQRAVHPVLERRYRDIAALRHDLAEYRKPLERDRANALDRIERRLKRECSQHEFEQLLDDVKTIQAADTGYPPARALRRQIESGLHRLTILADLDAVRIYVERANWPRAIGLLEDICQRAEGVELQRARVLLDGVNLVHNRGLTPPPAGFPPAIEALFRDDASGAAQALLLTPDQRSEARTIQWLLAARIQAYFPAVLVLRPHLLRLRLDLAAPGTPQEARRLLEEAESGLSAAASGRVQQVGDAYRQTGEALAALADKLTSLQLPNADALSVEARRAAEAAGAVAAQLQVVGQQSTGNPQQAHEALTAARLLDPVNPVFAGLQQTIEGAQALTKRIADYRPLADGSDLASWLDQTLADLQPYLEQIPDPRLGMVRSSLQAAATGWAKFRQRAVQGNRLEALEGLQQASDAVRRLNPELSAWLRNVVGVVDKARYVQRHALNAAFGRAMSDGWVAWDRGSGIEAERLGRLALEEVSSDDERAAADVLIRLGKLLRTWIEGHGEGDPDLTGRIDGELLGLLTEAEDRRWRTFTEQMPSASAYLKAMSAGLVQPLEQTSTAAQRVLFLHYILRGVLDMYERRPEDAAFWYQAAEQALPNAQRHIAYLALGNLLRDRQVVLQLADQINAIESVEGLISTRRQVESSALHLVIRPVVEALQDIEKGLPLWQRGDFRGAGKALETALGKIDAGTRLAHLDLTHFRAWVESLYRLAAELEVVRERLVEAAGQPQDIPDSRWADWHVRLAEDTGLYLGESYAAGFQQWRETYQQAVAIYTDDARRRTRKLRDLDEILNRPGIDQHPACGLYRFWREAIASRPEFPAPPTSEPVPRYADLDGPAIGGYDDDEPAQSWRRLLRPRTLIPVLLVLILVGVAGVVLLRQAGGGAGQIAVTWASFTPTLGQEQAALATEGAIQAATASAQPGTATPTLTLTPSDTPRPTETPTQTPLPTLAPGGGPGATIVPVLPTDTPAPTDTPSLTPTATQTPLVLPSPTVPTLTPTEARTAIAGVTEPLAGPQNMLVTLEQIVPVYPWPESWFRPGDLGGGWLMGIREVGSTTGLIQVVMPSDLLAQVAGPDAAIRLRRIEVALHLSEYEHALVSQGLVYFGLGLQGADESRIAIQVQMVREDALNIGARVGDEFRARSTVPVGDGRVVLALERLDDGNVILLFNGQQIGSPRFLTAPNAPVMPYLFVQQGGVVVSVSDLIADFNP